MTDGYTAVCIIPLNKPRSLPSVTTGLPTLANTPARLTLPLLAPEDGEAKFRPLTLASMAVAVVVMIREVMTKVVMTREVTIREAMIREVIKRPHVMISFAPLFRRLSL